MPTSWTARFPSRVVNGARGAEDVAERSSLRGRCRDPRRLGDGGGSFFTETLEAEPLHVLSIPRLWRPRGKKKIGAYPLLGEGRSEGGVLLGRSFEFLGAIATEEAEDEEV